VEVRVLDTVVVEGGNVKQWLYTDRRGFVKKMEGGKAKWPKVCKVRE